MFHAATYINGYYEPPPPNLEKEITVIVQDEVKVQAGNLAQTVAQEAKALLGDQVLLKTDVYAGTNVGLGRTPTGTGTNNLFLGRTAGGSVTVGGNNVIIGGYQGAAGTADTVCVSNASGVPLMQWVGSNRSAVQSVDVQSGAPTLSVDGTMALNFATDHLVSTVRAGGQNVTLNLYDASKYIMQTDLIPITQSLSKLKGTDTSVVLGAPNTNADYETIIGGKTSSRTFMSWPINKLSAIQSIEQSTALTSLTLPDSTMVQGYSVNGTVGTLVTKFRNTAGTEYTLNLQDAAQFATATNFTTLNNTVIGHTNTLATLSATTQVGITELITTVAGHTTQLTALNPIVTGNTTDITALTATVSGHTTQLTKLNGSGTSVVLGAPVVDTNYETIIGGKTSSKTFMSWPTGKLSAIQSIDQYTTLTSLTLPNSTMLQGYTVSGSVGTLVTKFRNTAGTEYTLNLQDAGQFATATNFTALNNTVTGHTTQITRLNGSGTSVVLGAALTDATYDTMISGTSANLSRVLMRWRPTKLSAIQTIDPVSNILAETLATGDLMLAYDSTGTLPTFVARYNDGTNTRLLNLRDASAFGSADAVTALQTLTANHTTGLTKLNGSGTGVVLGAANMDTNYETIIGGLTSSQSFMSWPTGKRSAIQSIDPSTAMTALTAANTMIQGYSVSGSVGTLVTRVRDTTGAITTMNLQDAGQFATATNLTNLTTTVTLHTTQITRLNGSGTSVVLGAALTDATYDTMISGTSANLSRVLMRWRPTKLSAIQTIDPVSNILAETLATGDLMLAYDSTGTLPTFVARYNDGTNTRLLNLRDASAFGSADAVTALQTLTANHTTQITTLNTTVTGHTTQITTLNNKVGKLDGTGTSAVLGAAAVDATYDAIISGTSTNLTRILMKWPNTTRSAIQSVDDAATLVGLTLRANTLALGYQTTPMPALVSTFSDASGVRQTLYHTMYRPLLDLTNTTGSNTCTLTATCGNRFCVYASTVDTTTFPPTINLCNFEAGTEIEIFNNCLTALIIAAPAQTSPAILAGTIKSVNSNTKINVSGAAVVKVYSTGSATKAAVFFLIGSLS